MSDRPDPKNGQVTSLTEHRASKSGGFQKSAYDCSYRCGEAISCDNPDAVYFVRVGTVALVTEIQAEFGNRQRVTIDYVGQGEPILVRGLFPSLKEDQFELIADTDVIVAEIPRDGLTTNDLALTFLRNFTRVAATHVVALRHAYLELLRKLQDKSDQSTNDTMSLQLDLGAMQTEAKRLTEENRKLSGRISSLEFDLRKARADGIEARKLSKEALEFLQTLEQRQREESDQVLQIVNDVLSFEGKEPLEPEDLMFILTTEREHGCRTAEPSMSAQILPDIDELIEVPEDAPQEAEPEPSTRPRMDTVSFELEPPTAPSAGSSYCLVGEAIAQDPPIPRVATSTPELVNDSVSPENTWADEPASSQRGAVMPPPGWDYEDDPSLFEDTRDIVVPDSIRHSHQQPIEVPSQFPRFRETDEGKPATPAETPPMPRIVVPTPRQNEGYDKWSGTLEAWDGENERPTSSGQPPANCPSASTPDPQQAGRTTSVWDVVDIKKKAEEARKR